MQLPLLLAILRLHDIVGILHQLIGKASANHLCVKPHPVAGAHVVGVDDTHLAACPQLLDALGLAFHGHDREMCQIVVAEHVPAHIEHQHLAGAVKFGERHFLLHIIAQGETKIP